jgi:hypothetical protein
LSHIPKPINPTLARSGMGSVVGGDRKERSWEKPTSRADGGDESEGDMFRVVREQNQEIDESKKMGY